MQLTACARAADRAFQHKKTNDSMKTCPNGAKSRQHLVFTISDYSGSDWPWPARQKFGRGRAISINRANRMEQSISPKDPVPINPRQ
jgi:hypothetical protein